MALLGLPQPVRPGVGTDNPASGGLGRLSCSLLSGAKPLCGHQGMDAGNDRNQYDGYDQTILCRVAFRPIPKKSLKRTHPLPPGEVSLRT
jgi:hypothetical protein